MKIGEWCTDEDWQGDWCDQEWYEEDDTMDSFLVSTENVWDEYGEQEEVREDENGDIFEVYWVKRTMYRGRRGGKGKGKSKRGAKGKGSSTYFGKSFGKR